MPAINRSDKLQLKANENNFMVKLDNHSFFLSKFNNHLYFFAFISQKNRIYWECGQQTIGILTVSVEISKLMKGKSNWIDVVNTKPHNG